MDLGKMGAQYPPPPKFPAPLLKIIFMEYLITLVLVTQGCDHLNPQPPSSLCGTDWNNLSLQLYDNCLYDNCLCVVLWNQILFLLIEQLSPIYAVVSPEIHKLPSVVGPLFLQHETRVTMQRKPRILGV
jgi:hypothetical protein